MHVLPPRCKSLYRKCRKFRGICIAELLDIYLKCIDNQTLKQCNAIQYINPPVPIPLFYFIYNNLRLVCADGSDIYFFIIHIKSSLPNVVNVCVQSGKTPIFIIFLTEYILSFKLFKILVIKFRSFS